MQTINLKDRVALITGSTSGIGLATAEILASYGAHIILNGFGDKDQVASTVQNLKNTYKIKVSYDASDLSKPDEVRTMIKNAVNEFGRLDILVNNAGIQHTSPVESFPADKWQLILDLMLSAPFYAIQEALPVMRKNGWGRIVNIASVHGLVASVNKAAYVSAKHGLIGLSKVVGLETARENITCNAICPGWVHTPLVQKQIDDMAARDGISVAAAQDKLLGEKQPSAAFTKPEQIGELVAFICSESATQLRGSAWTMDGGWTAQ